jgi:hypothetical protein
MFQLYHLPFKESPILMGFAIDFPGRYWQARLKRGKLIPAYFVYGCGRRNVAQCIPPH